MTTRFERASAAEWRALKTSPAMQGAVGEVAQDGLEYAQMIAPVDTGAYRDSFHLDEVITDDRAVAFLVNDADHAAEVEWGQGRHVLSRALDYIEGGL